MKSTEDCVKELIEIRDSVRNLTKIRDQADHTLSKEMDNEDRMVSTLSLREDADFNLLVHYDGEVQIARWFDGTVMVEKIRDPHDILLEG